MTTDLQMVRDLNIDWEGIFFHTMSEGNVTKVFQNVIDNKILLFRVNEEKKIDCSSVKVFERNKSDKTNYVVKQTETSKVYSTCSEKAEELHVIIDDKILFITLRKNDWKTAMIVKDSVFGEKKLKKSLKMLDTLRLKNSKTRSYEEIIKKLDALFQRIYRDRNDPRAYGPFKSEFKKICGEIRKIAEL